MEITYRANLDMHKPGSQMTIYAKVGDTMSRRLVISLKENGRSYPLYGEMGATIYARKPDGTEVLGSCTISEDTITYVLSTQMLAVPGSVDCELILSENVGEDLSPESRFLKTNGAHTSASVIAFDGGSVEADALAGRTVLIGGVAYYVNGNTATTMTLQISESDNSPAAVTAADNTLIFPGETSILSTPRITIEVEASLYSDTAAISSNEYEALVTALAQAAQSGTKGDKGDPGTPGAAGSDGAAATVSVGTVTTGAAGSQASVSNSGSSSAAVLNFVLPKGDKGATGETGPAGAAGSDGAAATVSVGTVTTGAAGSQASVSNSGSSSAAVLDFVIPKGDQGASGSGSGDMSSSIYDPQGKAADAFDYANMSNRPSIPTKTSDLTNDSGFTSDAIVRSDSVSAFSAGTSDMSAGVSALETGTVYFVYE